MAGQLSLEQVVELSGEPSAADIRQLTLRAYGLHSFEAYAQHLQALECLSLSHNQLTTLAGFTYLTNLVTLNVNSNKLTSLAGLEACSNLQQLYVANNRIRDLQPLAGLTQLSTIHCLKNSISDFSACLQVLSGLPALSEIDLSGNPVALVSNAKHTLIHHLPSLQLLDGDRVAALDRQLAAEHMQQQVLEQEDSQGGQVLTAGQGVQILTLDVAADGNCQQPASPSCALDPAAHDAACVQHHGPTGQPVNDGQCCEASTRTSDLLGQQSGNQQGQLSVSSGAAASISECVRHTASDQPLNGSDVSTRAGRSASMGRPGTALPAARPATAARPGTAGGFTQQLASDPNLNDHPLLLEYLAKHVLCEGAAAAGWQGASNGAWGSRARGSFAARLRTTATVMSGPQAKQPVQQLVANGVIQSALAPASGTAASASALLEGATPHELIRQLVRLAEVLIQKLEIANKQLAARPNSALLSHQSEEHVCVTRPPSASTLRRAPSAGAHGPHSSQQQVSGAACQPGKLQHAAGSLTTPMQPQAATSCLSGADGPRIVTACKQEIISNKAVGAGRLQEGGVTSMQAEGATLQLACQGSIERTYDTSAAQGPGQPVCVMDARPAGVLDMQEDAQIHEVAQLRRQVKQLQVENQNMYWLADEYKRLKAELAALKGTQHV